MAVWQLPAYSRTVVENTRFQVYLSGSIGDSRDLNRYNCSKYGIGRFGFLARAHAFCGGVYIQLQQYYIRCFKQRSCPLITTIVYNHVYFSGGPSCAYKTTDGHRSAPHTSEAAYSRCEAICSCLDPIPHVDSKTTVRPVRRVTIDANMTDRF